VAGETRRQRRDARRAAGGAAGGGGQVRGPQIGADDDDGDGHGDAGFDAPVEPAVAVGKRRRFSFIRECWAELQKVDWPTRPQVIQGTAVVIIACVIVGVYLWGADQVLKPFVRDVLLGS
jgi:preprotein translocase subunit SecE